MTPKRRLLTLIFACLIVLIHIKLAALRLMKYSYEKERCGITVTPKDGDMLHDQQTTVVLRNHWLP